ncbi:hypothetical protein [Nocardioides sp.]|uniref:hypothetical protein n=1 Tax=Nocardioides sp. TaxID=35761 RepID=UPI003526F819
MSDARLFLHIGLLKTGTSYLQTVMWQNVEELHRQGLDMVPGSKRDTFHLMLKARDRYKPEVDPPEVATALERLPGQVAAATSDRILITEESLAPATPEQIEALLAACSAREVHLIVTLRDLGRQIPSAWQQTLQAGMSLTYRGYLRRLRRTEGELHNRYWSSKDVAAILDRWVQYVPAERIHLVLVPPPGAPHEELLQRFCRVVGVDPERLDREVQRSNESVGRVQAELLRRVNAALEPEFQARELYGDIGKRYFAVRVLGKQKGERIRVPRELEEWTREVSQRYVDAIAAGGYQVEGDLDDLLPRDEAFTDEGKVSHKQVAEAAVAALARMLSDDMVKLRSRKKKARARRGTPTGMLRRAFGSARRLG